MKKIILFFLVSFSVVVAQENKFHKSAETDNATILQIGDTKDWCPVCGMNLKMFYKTNHALELDDGTATQYCSIRCLCADKPNYKNHIKRVLVVDAKTEKLIDVEKAFYVVGSDVPGTMTKTSKIAFSSENDAKNFSQRFNGNKILDFKSVAKLAKSQMEKDNAMLMKKKQMKIYPKGKKLFEKLCNKKIDLPNFRSISDLKSHLKNSNLCSEMDEKQLQMVALYLWDIKGKEGENKTEVLSINVSQNEKCPVCGMFVYKYPRWAAVLNTVINNQQKDLYFDGVKDLVKFYFEPQKWGNYENIKINKVIVTDYYKQTSLDGKLATYVINSDIYGPMGNELIPFESEDEAKTFIKDHGGILVKDFGAITSKIINGLDE